MQQLHTCLLKYKNTGELSYKLPRKKLTRKSSDLQSRVVERVLQDLIVADAVAVS